MPKFLVQLGDAKDSILKKIVVTASAYDYGAILLTFDPKLNPEKMKKVCADLRGFFGDKIVIFDSEVWCTDIIHLRRIIDYLVTQGLIANNDRPDIGVLCQKIEEILKQRAALSFSMNQAQRDTLLSVAELYIDDIIDNCKDHEVTTKLLAAAFYPECNKIGQELKDFLVDKKIDKDVFDSVMTVWKIAHGEGNLESTHLRMGKLPKLDLQRFSLVNLCLKKLIEKYAELDQEQQFFMVASLLLYKFQGQTLSPLYDINKVIAEALNSDEAPQEEKNIMKNAVWNPDKIILLIQALNEVVDEKRGETLIDLIKKMQQKFKSTLLAKHLAAIEKQQNEEMKPLFQGLKRKDKAMVREALSKGEDVNQYFACSRTPLIWAAQDQDEEMVGVILEFKPDVSKRNSLNTYSALYAAINRGHAQIAKLLLDAGASVFSPCGKTPLLSNIFKEKPDVKVCLVDPLLMALNKFKTDKTQSRYNLLKLLLHYGAGVLFSFTADSGIPIELLDKVVNIAGGTKEDFPLIKTAADFKKHISTTDYLHWQAILKQALNHEGFVFFPERKKEVLLVLDHIEKYFAAQNAPKVDLPATKPVIEVKSIRSIAILGMMTTIKKDEQNGLTKIIRVLNTLSQKFNGLYFMESGEFYEIIIANCYVIQSVEQTKQDITKFLEVHDKEIAITKIQNYCFVPLRATSFRSILMDKLEKLSVVGSKLERVVNYCKLRNQSIKDRYQNHFMSFKEILEKKLEVASSFPSSQSSSSQFRRSLDFPSYSSQQLRGGILESSFRSGILSFGNRDLESKVHWQGAAGIHHSVRGASSPGPLGTSSFEFLERQRQETIAAQNAKFEVELKLRSKQEEFDRNVCCEQEMTLVNFFNLVNAFEAKKIRPEDIESAWFNSFPLVASKAKLEQRFVEKEQENEVTIQLESNFITQVWYEGDKSKDLWTDIHIIFDQIKNIVLDNQFPFSEIKIVSFEQGVFTIKLKNFSVKEELRGFFQDDLENALVQAGLEKVYRISNIIYGVRKELTAALEADSARGDHKSEQKTVASSPVGSEFSKFGSPVTATGHAHDFFLKEIKNIKGFNSEKFQKLLISIENKNYAQALRRACTSNDPVIFEAIKILLRHKTTLRFDIDELAGEGVERQGAIHYAAKKGHKAIYDLLVEHGAKPALPDGNGITAEFHMNKHKASNKKAF